MATRNAIVNGLLYDVYDPDIEGQELDSKFSAIEMDGIVYPYLPKNDGTAGFFKEGSLIRFNQPKEEDRDNYDINSIEYIDFDNVENVRQILEVKKKYDSMEASVLTRPDKIFRPIVQQNDMPEMIALKEAIVLKNIDLDKYSRRFGENFNNDKRLFEKNSITLSKIRTICEALDIDCYIRFQDKEGDIPNPMNASVEYKVTNIAEGGADNEAS